MRTTKLVLACLFINCARAYTLETGIIMDRNTSLPNTVFLLYPSSSVQVEVRITAVVVNRSMNFNFSEAASRFDILMYLNNGLQGDDNSCLPESRTCTETYYEDASLFLINEDVNWRKMTTSNLAVTSQVLCDVIKRSDWKTFAILYDSCSESIMNYVFEDLSRNGYFTTNHLINETQSSYYILNTFLEVQKLHKSQVSNFLIICHFLCVRQILDAANDFDKFTNSTTAMFMFSRFLIISSSKSAVPPSLALVRNLDNVAVVQQTDRRLTSARIDPKQVLHESLHEVFRKENREYNGIKLSHAQMIKELKEMMIETLSAPDFNVLTAIFNKNHKRHFLKIADWSKVHGLKFSGTLFPNSNFGFNKRHIVVGTLPWPMFVNKKQASPGPVYSGLTISLLEEMSSSLNFSYSIVEPPDGEWGGRKKTGQWSGLVGMMQTKSAFAVFAPLSASAERSEVMDFVMPYYYDYYTILLKMPDPVLKKWKTLLTVFSWPVLVTILASLPAVSIFIFLTERANPFYAHSPTHPHSGWSYHKYINVIWYMYGALMSQGGIHLPLSMSGRAVICSWWLFCIIVTVTFSGNLIASITVNKQFLPFNTLDDLYRSEYTYGMLGGTVLSDYIQNSDLTDFKNIWNGIQTFLEDDPDILTSNHRRHIERVNTSNYAYIVDKMALPELLANNCRLLHTKYEFFPLAYSVGLTYNSPFFDTFNKEMMRILESGLVQIWKQKFSTQPGFCNRQTKRTVVQLVDVQSAFYVYFIGITIGAWIFFLEKLLPNINHWINPRNSGAKSNQKEENTMNCNHM